MLRWCLVKHIFLENTVNRVMILVILFSLLPSSLGQISICPTREITASSGRNTSPNYPRNYSSNTDCTLTIRQPLDTRFTFTFTKIDIEGGLDVHGRDCLVDFVEISGRSSKKFCGKSTPPSFTPDLNVVKLRFSTDGTGEQKGFDLNFTSVLATNRPPAVSVCPTRTITPNAKGRVHSPGFNYNYSANLDCKLTLTVPADKEVQVTLNYIDIEGTILCAKDKLLLTDKTGDSKIPVCGFLPNPNPFSETVTLKGGDVSFHFTTDASESRSGFEVTYQLIDKSLFRGTTNSFNSDKSAGGANEFSVTVVVILVVVVVLGVAVAITCILVYCVWKRKKRDRNWAEETVQIPDITVSKSGYKERETTGDNAQSNWAMSPIPDAEGVRKEPETQKAQPVRNAKPNWGLPAIPTTQAGGSEARRHSELSSMPDADVFYEQPVEESQAVTNEKPNRLPNVERAFQDRGEKAQPGNQWQPIRELSPISDFKGGYDEATQMAQSRSNTQQNWRLPVIADIEGVYEDRAQMAKPSSDAQPNGELQPVPGVEGGYEEPVEKAQAIGSTQPSSIPHVEGVYEDRAKNPQSRSKAQANGELSPISNVQGGYEEPSRYQHLDSSQRVPIDANYQRLNAQHKKLDRRLNEDIQARISGNNASDVVEYIIIC